MSTETRFRKLLAIILATIFVVIVMVLISLYWIGKAYGQTTLTVDIRPGLIDETRQVIAVVIAPENDKDNDVAEEATEIIHYKLSTESLIYALKKEMFEPEDNTKIRECFSTRDCVFQRGQVNTVARVLYGTVSKTVTEAKDKKKSKKKFYTSKLTLLDVIHKQQEKTWECQQRQSYEDFFQGVAAEIITIVKKTQIKWPEIKPAKTEQPVSVKADPTKDLAVKQVKHEKTQEDAKFEKAQWPILTSIVLMGAGTSIVAGGVAYFGSKSDADRTNYDATDVQREAAQFRSESESAAKSANLSLAIGSSVFATGAAIFILDHFHVFDKKQKAPQATIIPIGASVALLISF